MEPFIKHSGIVVPLDRMNVDTDQIIPKQFLKRIERTGFGEYLFYDWRYLDDGTPDPDFVLNKPRYSGASILLTKDNFGSGSSREHAPWSLKEYGFRSIIATSFADIFYNNCFKNSILPIVLPPEVIDELFSLVEENIGYSLTVDLEKQLITDNNNKKWSFEIDPFKKDTLLKGLDDISQTLVYENYIGEYESRTKEIRSWQLPKQ